MTTESEQQSAGVHRVERMSLRRLAGLGVAIGICLYLVMAYFFLPAWWKRYERRHPAIESTPVVTVTSDGHPGDPINLALIGSELEVSAALKAAGWFAADPLGMKSDLKIAADTVLSRPYDQAPVSHLFLWGRKEDLAFEQPVGHDPRQRHHVRFWKSAALDGNGQPLWAGAVTYDRRVGFSHTTGQITHHIDGNVDAERDRLLAELKKAGAVNEILDVPDFHVVKSGRNGGGDEWHTDGRLLVGTLSSGNSP